MGLSLGIGALTERDPEFVEMVREELAAVNRLLAAHGLPRHREPRRLPRVVERVPLGSLPHGWFDRLRRAVAHARNGRKRLRPPRPDDDPAEDKWVIHELTVLDSHIVCHSDSDGYYVPVDFPWPLLPACGQKVASMANSELPSLGCRWNWKFWCRR